MLYKTIQLFLLSATLILLLAACSSNDANENEEGKLNTPCKSGFVCDAGLLCDKQTNLCKYDETDGDEDIDSDAEIEATPKTSCDDVDCSNLGQCEIEDGFAVCVCEQGYTNQDADCVVITCTNCGTFKKLSKASFKMGNDLAGGFESPEHAVTINTFYMQQSEVTFVMYLEFINAKGSHTICGETGEELCLATNDEDAKSKITKLDNIYQTANMYKDHPAGFVTYAGAVSYCKWIEAKLPTEAQWEFAARADDSGKYPWGNDEDLNGGQRANCRESDCNDGFDGSAPIGSFPKGDAGEWIHDLAGNASEWMSDWFGDYSEIDASNPTGPASGTTRVTRGGGFNSMDNELGSTNRKPREPDALVEDLGFRCVKNQQ